MFFERPESGEITILVHITMDGDAEQEDVDEFRELALSAGAVPVATVTGSRQQPTPSHYIGTGKLAELQAAVRQHQAELVLFNHSLSPSQERNLEKELRCRVLDRTGLILDIFAQRARSHEGKLQVELAQLQHLSTRLKRGWTHLDRQKGGARMRGAGEKQLELDQRMIRQRIKSINKSLDKVRAQRKQSRRARTRAELPTLSLVGYTNAGKSTLFNALTSAEAYAADQLFATLDSTLRRVQLPNFGNALLADTVGFISHLPHQLVEAFSATLEETARADLLLHVIDLSNERQPELIAHVEEVLEEIEADDIPQLQVLNKIDRLHGVTAGIDRDSSGVPIRVRISAKTGEGLELLRQAISERLTGVVVQETIRVTAQHSRLRSQLYEKRYVESEQADDSGAYLLRVKMPRESLQRILDTGSCEILHPASAEVIRADWPVSDDIPGAKAS